MKRRQFIEKSAQASLVYSALPLYSATLKKQNNKVALIGTGWWGMNILNEAMAYEGTKVVGLCDVDQSALKTAYTKVKDLTGDKPKQYTDYRELLTELKPDIAIIGTPDHWHALPAIMAIQQGCHVYLEKPIGHTINEGKAILKAARDHERVVQVGTHRRISPHNMSGMEFLRAGKAGKISSVKCFVNYGGGPGEKTPDQEVPEGLDWNMWCGPAPMRPYNPTIHPKGFRNYLDYANGTIGDWGIHWFDQVLWWTEERFPKKIYSTGNRFVKQDNFDAPDTQYALFEFESFSMHWEHKLAAKNANEAGNVGCYFYGTEGTFHMGWRDGWTFYPSKKGQSEIHVDPQLNEPDQQNIKELWADFVQAIETGQKPVCDIQHGHLATNISLLAMISYKMGRSIEWDGTKELIVDDAEASKLLAREYRGDWEYPKV